MIRYLLAGILLQIIVSSSLAQETGPESAENENALYVTDQLRLSLYQQADAQSGVIQLLTSGDKLVIDRFSGPYALVTAPSGSKGWVKRGFLVSKPTFNILLEQEISKNKILSADLEKLENSKLVIDQYEADLQGMNVNVTNLAMENENLLRTVDDLNAELESIRRSAEQAAAKQLADADLLTIINAVKSYWQYLIALLVAVILLVFIISKVLIEARIKRKFQGIKIW